MCDTSKPLMAVREARASRENGSIFLMTPNQERGFDSPVRSAKQNNQAPFSAYHESIISLGIDYNIP